VKCNVILMKSVTVPTVGMIVGALVVVGREFPFAPVEHPVAATYFLDETSTTSAKYLYQIVVARIPKQRVADEHFIAETSHERFLG